jgi:hypothetical protein
MHQNTAPSISDGLSMSFSELYHLNIHHKILSLIPRSMGIWHSLPPTPRTAHSRYGVSVQKNKLLDG